MRRKVIRWGGEPFVAVDDDFVALTANGSLNVCRIRRRNYMKQPHISTCFHIRLLAYGLTASFSHAKCRPDLAVHERHKPLLFLLRRPVAREDLCLL